MYLFLLFFPILYMFLLYTLRVLSLSAQEHVKLCGIITVLHIPVALITLVIFRFLISKAYTLFTTQYVVLYMFIAFFPYIHTLFFIQRIVRHTSFWTKECIVIAICVLEFWFALGSLLIAHNFFTYREYFLHPLVRISIVIPCALAVISGRTYTYVCSALVIAGIGIIAMFLAMYAHVVQALILILIIVFFHAFLLFYYTLLRHTISHKNRSPS